MRNEHEAGRVAVCGRSRRAKGKDGRGKRGNREWKTGQERKPVTPVPDGEADGAQGAGQAVRLARAEFVDLFEAIGSFDDLAFDVVDGE